MTKFMQPSFSVNVGGPEYADGWERTFGPKPENGHGAGDDFGGEDFSPLEAVREMARKIYEEDGLSSPHERLKSELEQTSKKLGRYIDSVMYDKAPVDLDDYQKRQVAWAEHNFPVKATEEHRRVAREWIARAWEGSEATSPEYMEEWFGSDIDSLAYLLASRDRGSWQPLLGAVEEIGELCHAYLKNAQGIRGTAEEWRAKKQDAIGDVLVYLMDYCNREGFSMSECLETAWAEVSARDWVRFPKNGRTE